MKKYFAIFFFVVLLGCILRFYHLSSVPGGLNLDEVAMGYDAFSILKTGHDQYGSVLPIYFRSHDDYKPPFIIYSQVIPIALLGLNALAVRFPSALFGVGAVIFTYLLSRELFPRQRKVALAAAFLFAISPWALQFNRTAYEVGMQPFLTSGGLFFFLKGLRKKAWWALFLAGAFLGIGTHLYTASRVFIPLLTLILLMIFIKQWWPMKKTMVAFFVGLAIFLIPTFYLFTTVAGQTRFKGTNLFQDYIPHERQLAWQTSDWLRGDNHAVQIFHPGRIEQLAYLPELFQTYFAHLRLDFLFFGNPHSSTDYVPNTGLIYPWELPFILAGLYTMFKRGPRPSALILGVWLLLAPLPAAVTTGIPTAIRMTISLPVWQIISAVGLVAILSALSSRPKIKGAFCLGIVGVMGYFFVYYLHMYYIHAPYDRSHFWYTPYQAMVKAVESQSQYYEQVIVSTELDQPQSFFLFYTAYDPKTYWEKDGGTVSGSFAEENNHFANFKFKRIRYGSMQDGKKTLFVGRPTEFPSEAPVVAKFYDPSGKEVVRVVGKKL